MAKFLFSNFGTSNVAQDVEAHHQIITLMPAQGQLFPEPDNSKGELFALVLRQPDGTPEIVHCYDRVGDVLHVLRAKEGTTAQFWVEGSDISCRTTAQALNEWATADFGGLAIDEDHHFADTTERNTYFTAHPAERVHGTLIAVGTGFQMWDGTGWQDKTALLQGPQGPVGDGTAEVVAAKDAALVEITDAAVAEVGAATTAITGIKDQAIQDVDGAETTALGNVETARVTAVGDVNAAKDEALAEAGPALAAANFKGAWSALTGVLSRPASVWHAHEYWMLLVESLADVTVSEPAYDNADWARIVSAAGLSTPLIFAPKITSTTGSFVRAVHGLCYVLAENANNITLTIPENEFQSGDWWYVQQEGDGVVTIEPANAATQSVPHMRATDGKGAVVCVVCLDSTVGAEAYNILGGI